MQKKSQKKSRVSIVDSACYVMQKPPRPKVLSLQAYMDNIRTELYRADIPWQREFGSWSKIQKSELLATILSGDTVPEIILAADIDGQVWIVDGKHRTMTIQEYIFLSFKISTAVSQPYVYYQRQKKDDDGNLIKDDRGRTEIETCQFDIRSSKYNDLPPELKKRVDEFQIRMIIHENCTMDYIATLEQRYNNHTSMNTEQKAVTNLGKFAYDVKQISQKDLFMKSSLFSEAEITKGKTERMVIEAAMLMYHPDKWVGDLKRIAKTLDENASIEEFDKLSDNVDKLWETIKDAVENRDERVTKWFTKKDTFLFLALFDKFLAMNRNTHDFVDFLKALSERLENKKVNSKTFAELDEKNGTKDTTVVTTKMETLEKLMYDFLQITPEEEQNIDTLDFVKKIVGSVSSDDLDFAQVCLDGYMEGIDSQHPLLQSANNPSLIALVAYTNQQDIEPDAWFKDYFAKHHEYNTDQSANFKEMVADLENYIAAESL